MHIINYYIHKFSQESLYHRFQIPFCATFSRPGGKSQHGSPAHIWSTEKNGTFGSEIGSSFVPISYTSELFLPNHILIKSPNSGGIEYKIYKFIDVIAYSTMVFESVIMESAVSTDYVYCTLDPYLMTINIYNT